MMKNAEQRPCTQQSVCLVKSAENYKPLTNMLNCSRRAMCAAKCIHSHERRHCPMMHLDASISAASKISVVRSQQRASKAGKGHRACQISGSVQRKSTASLSLT